MDEHLKTDLQYAQETLQSARDWDCQPGNNQEVVIANLIVTMEHVLSHLESQLPQEAPQASEESSPTTASRTTDDLLGAVENLTQAQTKLLRRLLGALTEAELTAVGKDYALRDRLVSFVSWFKMLAPDVHGITSTLVSEASRSFAVASGSAMSPSPVSSKRLVCECGHSALTHRLIDGEPIGECSKCDCRHGQAPSAAPEPSPTPSHEAREHEMRVAFNSINYWLDAIDEINGHREGSYKYQLQNIRRRIASVYDTFPSQSSQEGAQD